MKKILIPTQVPLNAFKRHFNTSFLEGLSDIKENSSSERNNNVIQEMISKYDLNVLKFQKNNGIESIDSKFDIGNKKTGAEMRKEAAASAKLNNSNKKRKTKPKVINTAKKFVLGNGVTGLSPQSLIGLVKSTVPYYFDGHLAKLVQEDDVDEFEVNEFDDEKINSIDESIDSVLDIPSMNKHRNVWDSIFENGLSIKLLDKPVEEDRVKYFALCLASHFVTVASYVPTDVDSKIRGHCWNDPSHDVLKAQFEILKEVMKWDARKVSKRVLSVDYELVSGHDGEWLGVLIGALGAFLRTHQFELAKEVEAIIDEQLNKEVKIFKKIIKTKSDALPNTMMLKLSAIMTHNVGDIDQGLSYWNGTMTGIMQKKYEKYSLLAHTRFERFNGIYGKAKAMYSKTIASEGHRNYPLREAKCLRKHSDLLLPLSPWLEHWGRVVATHGSLSHTDRMSVIRQLLKGCDSESRAWCVPGQVGYFRALHGISTQIDLEKLVGELDTDCQRVLHQHETKVHLATNDEAFAKQLGTKARQILADLVI